MNQYSLDAAAQLLLKTTRETNCDGAEEELLLSHVLFLL